MFTTNFNNNLFLIPVDNYFSSKYPENYKNINFEDYETNINNNLIKEIKDLISFPRKKSKNSGQNVIFTDCLKNEWKNRILVHKIKNIYNIYNNNHNNI